MKKLTLATLGLLAASIAVAQPPATGNAGAGREGKSAALFAESDSNHDGKLSMAEWQQAQNRLLAKRFEKMDLNRDGSLVQDEMRQARSEHRASRKDKSRAMREKAKALDTNGDQALSRAEIGDAMPKVAENFASIDLDNDGKLSRDELRAGRKALREQAR